MLVASFLLWRFRDFLWLKKGNGEIVGASGRLWILEIFSIPMKAA